MTYIVMLMFLGLTGFASPGVGLEGRSVIRSVLEISAVLESKDVVTALKNQTSIDAVIQTEKGYDIVSGDCTLHVRIIAKIPEPLKKTDLELVIDPIFCTK